MCVGLSAKVVKVDSNMAVVDAQGARRTVATNLLDDLEEGDYVMVHAGIAIAKISCSDEEESNAVLESVFSQKKGEGERV